MDAWITARTYTVIAPGTKPPSVLRERKHRDDRLSVVRVQALQSAAARLSVRSRQQISKVLYNERRELVFAQFVYSFARGLPA